MLSCKSTSFRLFLSTTLQHSHGLFVYPHFVGRLLFIYSCYCSSSLIIHNSRIDAFPKVHKRKCFDDIGAMFLFCFRFSLRCLLLKISEWATRMNVWYSKIRFPVCKRRRNSVRRDRWHVAVGRQPAAVNCVVIYRINRFSGNTERKILFTLIFKLVKHISIINQYNLS